jgi:RNA polymerase sigma-70 factor, ECF subfamily
MLVEKEALLVAGLEEFGQTDVITQELALIGESRRTGQACPCPSEAVLITRLMAGEIAAFDELVVQYQSLVYALSFRILGDMEDARDATQETFLKVYRHFSHFRREASLKTWICRIAINQARTTERWWRRRHRSEITSLDAPIRLNGKDDQALADHLTSPYKTPEAIALTRERGQIIERALGGLKKDFRIAVILRDIEGLAYDEIAYVTGVSIGTVKSRIARGREMLREIVQGEEGARC